MATQPNRSRLSNDAPSAQRAGDDNARLILVAAACIATYLAYRFVRAHTTFVLIAAVLAAITAAAIGCAVARRRDRRAARLDPPAPGIIVGTVKRDSRLAKPRAFRIPWQAFHQHVLIDGPTGAGKTFTYIEPTLRGFCATRKPSGIFYLDGKGDRVDRRPGISFDHVFCPEDPNNSAHWNPLAGPEPVGAATNFAAALFPEATEPGANFYEAKAVAVITKVVPAMAITGYGLGGTSATEPTIDPDALERLLVTAGIDPARAAHYADIKPDVAARQLAYRRLDPTRSAGALAAAIDADHAPPAAAAQKAHHEVTPAALNSLLFGADGFAGLVDALEPYARAGGYLAQLRDDIAALAAADSRQLRETLQNLQNRLGAFLAPPFDRLCSRSDFQIGDVAAARKVAFLLPVGRFPTAAQPLGRLALTQFKNAVLASQPGIRKVAVLDEFHNFVSDDWGPFLNQARSRDGAAVMAIQSLADLPPATQQAMLANARTVVVTPGVSPGDADYWAQVFGREVRERHSYSHEQRSVLAPRPRAQIRVDHAEEYRWTPSEIAELHESYALIRVTNKRTIFPVAKVRVERG